jgi:hypothetical protein
MSAVQNGKKPTAKEQKPGQYIQVERGIYRYKDLTGEITYHERPWIIGKNGKPVRTYKTLGLNFTRQENLNAAREEYQRRRTEVAAGRNPYEEKKPEVKTPDKPTVSGIIRTYVTDNYPDRYLRPRTGRTLEGEKIHCESLLRHWDGQLWDSITPQSWDEYHEQRIVEINGQETVDAWKLAQKIAQKAGKPCEVKQPKGDRAVDLERNTLLSAYKYSFRKGIITSNPVTMLPRFHPTTAVKHCREFKTENADELHEVAGLLFSKRSTEALAWQLIFEANTALRTSEVLMLRMDAKPGEPGYIDKQDNMSVHRCKGGINPFVHVHKGMKALLKAHAVWHALRYPDNPYFIPGKKVGEPMKRRALAHAMPAHQYLPVLPFWEIQASSFRFLPRSDTPRIHIPLIRIRPTPLRRVTAAVVAAAVQAAQGRGGRDQVRP